MLTRLHIENFALIADIDCTFKDKMNVIIGETGAGKSILMQAVSLLIGAKSDFEKIRNGQSKAFIEGEFTISDEKYALLKKEYSDYIEDNEIIISRTLDIKGKSLQRLNGYSVPLSLIKKISHYLIDIHSPQEDLFFYDEKKQINILDSFIFANENYKKDEKYFLDYSSVYERYIEIEEKIKTLNDFLNSDIDREYLEYQLDELEKANIQENELEDLETSYASFHSLMDLTNKYNDFLSASEEGLNKLYSAKRTLETINNDSLNDIKEKYLDSYYLLSDYHQMIAENFEKLMKDSLNIEKIKERLFFLRTLKRKYGSSTSDILLKKKEIEETLYNLDNANYELNKLTLEREKILPLLDEKGELLNDVRKKYAHILEEVIDKELSELLFNDAKFVIEFNKCDYSKFGIYNVRFLLSANKGMVALPLKDSISLGESSRLLLAFKKVFFDFEHTDTLVFDEIDIGISGKAAIAVGNKIKELAKRCQILVISHLGQVSSKGDYFYLVKKEVNDSSTTSIIKELNKQDAITEIAKMINNGKSDSASLELINSWINS